jgi:hypothetical protein
VQLALSSFQLAPYMCLTSFPSSDPLFYSLFHHALLTCKKCSMHSLVLSSISTSWDNDMDHAHASCKFHTRVLLLEMDLASLFHILHECWTFVLMVPLCSTCGTPNNFSLVLSLIMIELKGKIIHILLQLLYSWIFLVVLIILLHLQGFLQSLCLRLEFMLSKWVFQVW